MNERFTSSIHRALFVAGFSNAASQIAFSEEVVSKESLNAEPSYRGQFTCLCHPVFCSESLPSPSLPVSVRDNLLPTPPATTPLPYAAINYCVCVLFF